MKWLIAFHLVAALAIMGIVVLHGFYSPKAPSPTRVANPTPTAVAKVRTISTGQAVDVSAHLGPGFTVVAFGAVW